jgi:large subunit ribosomal protein L18
MNQQERRKLRVRSKLSKVSYGRLRLVVHRTNKHIYAQLINDEKAITVVAASTVEKKLRGKPGSNKTAALSVGELIAERALKEGIKDVVFDRSGYLYHGRVKALADAAREKGLNF